MRVYLHVGPHKTGTTTVQKLLKAVYGSPLPRRRARRMFGGQRESVWYPSKEEWLGNAGAGHGGIARCFNGRLPSYDPRRGRDELKGVVETAGAAGVEKLLISSEDFAFATDDGIGDIRAALGDAPVRLIFSASPFKRRFVSLWAASVIFGNTRPIEQSQSLLDTAPTFSAQLYRRFVEGIKPASAAMVIADPEAPGRNLLKDFFAACDLDWNDGFETRIAGLMQNPSIGANEARMISLFNEIYRKSLGEDPEKEGRPAPFAHPDYVNARLALQRLFQGAEWKAAVSRKRTEFPESLLEPVRERAKAIFAEIDDLFLGGPFDAFGDPACLMRGIE